MSWPRGGVVADGDVLLAHAGHAHLLASGLFGATVIGVATLLGGRLALAVGPRQVVLLGPAIGFLLAAVVLALLDVAAAGWRAGFVLGGVALLTYGLLERIAGHHRHARVLAANGAVVFLAHRYMEGPGTRPPRARRWSPTSRHCAWPGPGRRLG